MAEKQHDSRPVSPIRPNDSKAGRDINAERDKNAGEHHKQPIEKVSNTLKPPTIPPGKPKG